MTVREKITTLFDLVGSVFVALGIGMGQFAWIGWWFGAVTGLALFVAGGVMVLEARVIDWVAVPESAPTWWRKRRDGRK